MMATIHNRMPVILDPDHWDPWMHTEPTRAMELEGLLVPAMDGTIYKTPREHAGQQHTAR